MEVEVLEEVNKLREEEEGANRVCWEGGPTKLPEKGGGQHQRPGKEEPLVGRRQEGASDHHRQHCWSLFLVGFLHPVRWHPPDNDRQCGGEISSSRLVNIRASLQFDIVFNILIIATQVGQHQSQLAVRHCLQHPHHCNSMWRREKGEGEIRAEPKIPPTYVL